VTPERRAELRAGAELDVGAPDAEGWYAPVLLEALDEIERLQSEAAHHAEAMRNGGVSLAWEEEQKRITAGLEAQLQQAHEVCRVQAAQVAVACHERDVAVDLLRRVHDCITWSDSTQTWGIYQRIRDILASVRVAIGWKP
jgi:hypothetical protein